MKRIFYLLFVFPAFLFSCNRNDTVQLQTSLPITIPVETIESSSTNQKLNQSEYSFTASKTFYLRDNDDVAMYLDNLKHITCTGYFAEVNGLKEGEGITNILFWVTESTGPMNFENISNSNIGIPLTNINGINTSVGDILLSEKQITIAVTGTTNKAPLNFDINVTLEVEVHAEEL